MTATLAQTSALYAGIYGRESKDKTKSVDDQLALGRETVAAQCWQLRGEYDDGSSASRFARKHRADWARLLADLAAGLLNVLVLWESSRGSREPVDWFGLLTLCRSKGVLIHVISHDRTYDPRRARDWKTLAEDGVSSAYETELTSERVRRGVADAAVAGGVHGRAPYGYERVYDDRTREFIEQRKSAAAPVVVEIFERIARSDPISAVVRDLNARGVPSSTGGQWGRDAIRRLVRNDAYAGQRRHRTARDGEAPTDNRYPAVWPAIVDEELFRRANAVLDRPDRRTTKPGKARHLLSYLAVAPCGGPMRVQPARRGHNARYACYRDACVTADVGALDEVVLRLIARRLAQPETRALFARDDAATAAAEREAAELRAKLDEARASFATPGGISAASLADAERRLAPQIADAEKRSLPAAMPGAFPELLDAAKHGAEKVRAVLDGLPVAARREVVAALAVLVVGKPIQRLSRFASLDERLFEAMARLEAGGSRWVGDDHTWAELASTVDTHVK